MQRRHFLKSTSVALAATLSGCGGGDSGGTAPTNGPAPPAPAPAPGPAAAPQPPPAGGFLNVPSQFNEQQTYDNVLSRAWTASDKTTTFGANPGPLSHGNITDDSEADDLWNHYQAYKRTGNPIYLQWAQRWRDYFVNTYYNQWAGGDGQEHTYGQGLVLWGVERNDSAALAAAAQICTRIESMVSGISTGDAMSYYGGRLRGRWLIVAAYYSWANPITRWVTLRNRLIDLWMASPDWQDTSNSNIAAGGHYFVSSEMHSLFPEFGSYGAGFRVNSAFMYALISEAFWRVYLLTARTDVRTRLIAMARFINHYCAHPTHVNSMSGGWWGHANGGYHYARHNSAGHTNPNTAPADPSYQTSHVNSMVIGYKLSGDTALLANAKAQFRKGTQYDDLGGPGGTKQPDNLVHHYIDTRDNSGGYFAYNKGELQYNYLIFENGGVPTVEA